MVGQFKQLLSLNHRGLEGDRSLGPCKRASITKRFVQLSGGTYGIVQSC
jgi:hypothetical protein